MTTRTPPLPREGLQDLVHQLAGAMSSVRDVTLSVRFSGGGQAGALSARVFLRLDLCSISDLICSS